MPSTDRHPNQPGRRRREKIGLARGLSPAAGPGDHSLATPDSPWEDGSHGPGNYSKIIL
jgi:hypothetical protein